MTVALSQAERSRLAAILGMLGSDHAGERDAAALAAANLVRAKGLTWPDVLLEPARDSGQPPPPTPPAGSPQFRCDLAICATFAAGLTAWEAGFVADMRRRHRPTTKQAAKLAEIAARLRKA